MRRICASGAGARPCRGPFGSRACSRANQTSGGRGVRTLAIINQKGGCGKTTTAINLAAVFADRGYKTLLIDLDPQSHCASGLAVPEKKIDRDIGDAMSAGDDKPVDPGRVIWRVGRRLDLAPSRTRLAGLEAPGGVLSSIESPHRRLSAVIERFNAARPGGYDVCLIDCSPSIGLLTYNALSAAREIVVPIETSFFSLQGASKQLGTVRSVGRKIGMRHRARLLPTIHDPESPLAADLLAELRDRFPDQLIPRVIRRDETVKLAASYGVPIIEHDPRSPAGEDYIALAEWLMEHARIDRSELPEQPEKGAPGIDGAEDDMPLGARWRRPRTPDDVPETEPAGRVVGSHANGAPRPAATNGTHPAPGRPSRAEELRRRAESMRPEPGPASSAASSTMERASREIAMKPAGPDSFHHEPASRSPEASSARDEGDSASESDFAARRAAQKRSAMERLFGARVGHGHVLFVQPIEEGERLCVAGEFNAWSPSSLPMRRNDALGVHELSVELPPGTHRYKIVADGEIRPDRYNGQNARDELGETVSLIEVPRPESG